jgi:hypothetical protein
MLVRIGWGNHSSNSWSMWACTEQGWTTQVFPLHFLFHLQEGQHGGMPRKFPSMAPATVQACMNRPYSRGAYHIRCQLWGRSETKYQSWLVSSHCMLHKCMYACFFLLLLFVLCVCARACARVRVQSNGWRTGHQILPKLYHIVLLGSK